MNPQQKGDMKPFWAFISSISFSWPDICRLIQMKKKSSWATWDNLAHCFPSNFFCEIEIVCDKSRSYFENGSTRIMAGESTQWKLTIKTCYFKDNNNIHTERSVLNGTKLKLNIWNIYCNTDIQEILTSYSQRKPEWNSINPIVVSVPIRCISVKRWRSMPYIHTVSLTSLSSDTLEGNIKLPFHRLEKRNTEFKNPMWKSLSQCIKKIT